MVSHLKVVLRQLGGEAGRVKRGEGWPLLLTAFGRSMSVGDSSSSYSSAEEISEEEEIQRRAAIAHQTQRLTNAVTVDAAQRTAEAVLELQTAKDIIRNSDEHLTGFDQTNCQVVCPPMQCASTSQVYQHSATQLRHQQQQQQQPAPALLSHLEQYQQAYLIEGPGATMQDAYLYPQVNGGPQLSYRQPQQLAAQPIMQQTTPQYIQPPPQLVQPPPQLVQPPPQLVQPPPQLVQPPPQLVQPPPQLVQSPPQLIQPAPQFVQGAPLFGGGQCVAASPVMCTSWRTCQPVGFGGGALGGQIGDMITEALNRHSLKILKSTAEETAKTATEELQKIPMETADAFARIERHEDILLGDPYYGADADADADDHYGYADRRHRDDYDDYSPYAMRRSH